MKDLVNYDKCIAVCHIEDSVYTGVGFRLRESKAVYCNAMMAISVNHKYLLTFFGCSALVVQLRKMWFRRGLYYAGICHMEIVTLGIVTLGIVFNS